MSKKGLILNPTENIPMTYIKQFSELSGFYISDDFRDENSKVIFAGREKYTQQFSKYKKIWCKILKSKDIDFRFLSGLHAHIITFMSLGNIGDKVLLLPEIAGGHFSTESILKRLGYEVISAVPDCENMMIDKGKTLKLIDKYKPKFAFIDRSEGLYYEDFSWIKDTEIPYCIFDASQYLTQILTEDYKSPFEMGFKLILSSLHKNYPGPQKAMLATNSLDEFWSKIIDGSSTFISNSHPEEMFLAGSSICNTDALKIYSKTMLEVSESLENSLFDMGVNVVKKDLKRTPTQHIWILFKNKQECYKIFKNLEKIGLYTNYRILPYNLGIGLRIGVGAAIQSGLRQEHTEELACIIKQCIENGYSQALSDKTINFISSIKTNEKVI